MKCVPVLIAIISCVIPVQHAARVLALIPYRAQSHFPFFDPLLKALAARGHEVLVVSHYPQKNKVPNYTDISLVGSMPSLTNKVPFELDSAKMFFPPMRMILDTTEMCARVFKHQNVQKLLKSEEKFDVIITEIFGSDCFLGFVHKFKAPFIGVMTSIAYPWSNFRVGNPDNPAYIPNYFLPYTQKMSFWERLKNSLYLITVNWAHYFFSEIHTYKISTEYLGDDIPPLSEIAKNSSLIFVNSHFSLNYPRPNVPAFVEVGGLHIKDPQPLPEEIKLFLDESEHGVIYFSMGTMVQSETLTSEKLQAFLDAFSELPQRVLWKCNATNLSELPPNVRTYSWMPQQDILGHPNVRLFITHCGMMGTQEAVHAGVPMLGIPLFADQMLNIKNYVLKGIAVELHFDSITKETISKSLRKLLYDPSYRENAQQMSRIFRDRPLKPLQTAIFWTEYVIRHGGAPHMRSAAIDLPLYRYLLLDVVACILLAAVFVIFVMYFTVSKIISLIHKNNSNIDHKQLPKSKKRN